MSLEVRAPRLDEAAAIAELANRESVELDGEPETTEDGVRLWLTAPDLDPDEDARVAVSPDGALIGYADCGAHPEPRYWLDIRVPPTGRDEVRAALLTWGEGRAAERGAGKPDAIVRAFVWSTNDPLKSLLERAGFRLIRHSYRMQIELEHEPPQPAWPDGVSVRPARELDAEAVYEAHMETFEDSWEHTRMPVEEWRHWLLDYEDLDLSLWFLAEANGELVGVSLCRRAEGRPELGWIRVLGVRRAWRRRGLGRALLLHSFHEFRRRGYAAVGLGVDAESLTGAHRLYENAGMRVVRRSDIYEKQV